MFTSVDGGSPGYTALTPHIQTARHVSPPSILGNNLAASPANRSWWASSADALARMGGGLPECMACMPSTSRWASSGKAIEEC